MNRRNLMKMAGSVATLGAGAAVAQEGPSSKPTQRLGSKYRFDDPDMDLFYVAALGWAPTGGLDLGQIHYIASRITDGDGDSWVKSFADYGDTQNAQAEAWKAKGWKRAAGEARLKAFASYRSSWQFCPPGPQFKVLYEKHRTAFATAMQELALPATFFQVPWLGKALPGVFLQNAVKNAPVVLVIGGADTCFEDLFLTVGRNLFERGYSVALVDLPGQGITAADGLHWDAEAEKPIAATTDLLVQRFGAVPGRIALLGLSLGGYFVARAAGYDKRFATVMASTPFPDPAQMFALATRAAIQEAGAGKGEPTQAALRSRMVTFWKAGARSPEELLARTAAMNADPSLVTVPFLSLLGGGDSPVFAAQARAWHAGIRSQQKSFVLLDAATGADGHVQVNGRLRLAQECCGWMDGIFA